MIGSYFSDEIRNLISEAVKEGLDKYIRLGQIHSAEHILEDKKVYSVKEAANYLHIAVATLRKKYSKNTIKYIQEGRKITFRRERLEEYLNRHTK